MMSVGEKWLSGSGSAWPDNERVAKGERQAVHQSAEMLCSCDFSVSERQALTALQWRYQHGGSDRAFVLAHLEFFRWLVAQGRLEA